MEPCLAEDFDYSKTYYIISKTEIKSGTISVAKKDEYTYNDRFYFYNARVCYSTRNKFIAEVTIPSSYKVFSGFGDYYIFPSEEPIMVTNPTTIAEFPGWQDDEFCKAGLNYTEDCFKFCKQTEEICELAIEKSVSNFHLIKNKTPKLCLAALKKDGRILKEIPKPTPEMIKTAEETEKKFKAAIGNLIDISSRLEFVLHTPFNLWQ